MFFFAVRRHVRSSTNNSRGSLSKYLSIPLYFPIADDQFAPNFPSSTASAISASRSLAFRDFDAIFRCVRPIVNDHSRLFDTSTLLDSTMDPFSLRLIVYSKSSSLPRPRTAEMFAFTRGRLCMFPVKAFGVVRSVNSECVHLSYGIQHMAIRTRTSTETLYLRTSRNGKYCTIKKKLVQ